MNRSVLAEVLHSTSLHITAGSLTVATSWRHPTRGPVDCPAHRLVAAHARQSGLAADSRPLPDEELRDGLTTAPTTVFTVSYERLEGGHRGLALAARSDDAPALCFARRQIESWRAVLRTRRVLYVAAQDPLGPRPSSASVPPQAPGGSRDRWRICGCPTAVACPSAENAERTLHRFLERGDEVVVVGTPVAGSPAWAGGRALQGDLRAVSTPRQAETLAVADPDRLAFVVAPGAVVSEVADILRVLRRRHPRLRGQHPREWCYTMDDLHTAVAAALAQSDRLLVVGRDTSPVTRTALNQAARAALRVRAVTTLDRLRPDDVDAATITVLDATVDGRALREVGRALDGLGPASHVWRQVHSVKETSHPASQPLSSG
ncbi:4-hydroxy-3-methylbut-2-enyl diphosphate reductase [Streptomyces sp. HD]|uniref:4-hydroxy-3-methylbut-2-enyl diphosphate reductase n=1 Tax=Streptomyces sp. HD TaxID=3020892 RepID=UPI00232E6B17|nr:4-hydroxy-3-methylbut-2-enyl diphosphate reductase [Streptomyces sp. HD]MDC0770690.1 4-hydroxy-3-methylbut-2-enyl diphosphate reductase [Streptomyces sp. HD]